jgi:hypothetical protein
MDENTEDVFMVALRTLLQEGGFVEYKIYTPDPSDPLSVIEAITMARSPEMMKAAAVEILGENLVLNAPSESIH